MAHTLRWNTLTHELRFLLLSVSISELEAYISTFIFPGLIHLESSSFSRPFLVVCFIPRDSSHLVRWWQALVHTGSISTHATLVNSVLCLERPPLRMPHFPAQILIRALDSLFVRQGSVDRHVRRCTCRGVLAVWHWIEVDSHTY